MFSFIVGEYRLLLCCRCAVLCRQHAESVASPLPPLQPPAPPHDPDAPTPQVRTHALHLPFTFN